MVIKFKKVTLPLMVTPYYSIFGGFKKLYRYYLPDQSYGEWIIYEKDAPKFYYSAISKNGDLKSIAKIAKSNKVEIEKALVKILKDLGYKKANIQRRDMLSIELYKESRVKAFELLELIEF